MYSFHMMPSEQKTLFLECVTNFLLFIVVNIIETYDCLNISLVTIFMLYCVIGIKLLNYELFKGRVM